MPSLFLFSFFQLLFWGSWFPLPLHRSPFHQPGTSHLQDENRNLVRWSVSCSHTGGWLFQTTGHRDRERKLYVYFQIIQNCTNIWRLYWLLFNWTSTCVSPGFSKLFWATLNLKFAFPLPTENVQEQTGLRLPRGKSVWFAPSQRVTVLSTDTFQSLIKAVRDYPRETPIKYHGSWFLQLLITFPFELAQSSAHSSNKQTNKPYFCLVYRFAVWSQGSHLTFLIDSFFFVGTKKIVWSEKTLENKALWQQLNRSKKI